MRTRAATAAFFMPVRLAPKFLIQVNFRMHSPSGVHESF
jgi:hypothetical protein